jgi:DNA helicase-2/ATP-dependent DNA helicase PcrA
MSTADDVLANLNVSQRAAVSSEADSLAILAGPGSGKTHTLTSRTAWLLKHKGLKPWNIIVATFTVKAAREMKERIGKLIGDGMESKLILGTFHSIALRYLVRYGHLIGVPKGFSIADSSDSLAIIKRICKRLHVSIDANSCRSRISSKKAKGSEYQPKVMPNGQKAFHEQEFDRVWDEYQETLKRSNMLDYDDLLLKCVELLRAYPACVKNVEAVLIDEFQDTNIVQFDLMRLFATWKKRVTIVGDPDQSIYGFRSAETKNFKRMLAQYPETVTIPLEENYRSSGAILLAALEVIQQDQSRIAKSLLPTHNVGTSPVLKKHQSSYAEAQWIVGEISRSMAMTGDLMTLDDYSILLRSAALSRHIETELGKAGIAYRMVGGLRFYERAEVKLILDYMRVVHQPDKNDAIARIINVPSRRIGEVTVKALLNEADATGVSLWSLILSHVEGKKAGSKVSTVAEKGLTKFVQLVLHAQEEFVGPYAPTSSILDLMKYIVEETELEAYLKKTYPEKEDNENRWANIEELKTQAIDFGRQLENGEIMDDALPEVDDLEQNEETNPLSKFLANIALALEVKADDTEEKKPQVTISTIHAAKGLEWPVVFIPSAYHGSIPHSRAEDVDEERRLLYVAMTRAKALLYMSYPKQDSRGESVGLSHFLDSSPLKKILSNRGPSFRSDLIQSIAQILGRPFPTLTPGLENIEDNDLGVGGNNGRTYDDEDRTSSYGRGGGYGFASRPSKRQRTYDDQVTTTTYNGYPMTVHSNTAISSYCAPTTSGFVSAGSHLRDLNAQSAQYISNQQASKQPAKKWPTVIPASDPFKTWQAETASMEPAKQWPPVEVDKVENAQFLRANTEGRWKLKPSTEPAKKWPPVVVDLTAVENDGRIERKSLPPRSTLREEGQKSISSFMSTVCNPVTAATKPSIPDDDSFIDIDQYDAQPQPHLPPAQKPTNLPTPPASVPVATTGIPPQLANRRLAGPTVLPAPSRREWDDEGEQHKKRAYGGTLYSSSPARPAASNVETERAPLIETTNLPVQTMHETSMEKFNAEKAQETRESYGARGGYVKPFISAEMAHAQASKRSYGYGVGRGLEPWNGGVAAKRGNGVTEGTGVSGMLKPFNRRFKPPTMQKPS